VYEGLYSRFEVRGSEPLTEERSLPTISIFYGVVIQMFAGDHPPPHFHVMYAEHEALIDLRDLRLMRGSLPRRAMALVLEWLRSIVMN
jgi:hypothetical protein